MVFRLDSGLRWANRVLCGLDQASTDGKSQSYQACEVNAIAKKPRSRPVVFGEVLFDGFPDGSKVLGGAPFNLAWHLQAFGLAPLFVSRVGNDADGRAIRAAMEDWGLDPSGLQTDRAHPSGAVRVSLRDNEPVFDIVPECAYDFIESDLFPTFEDAGPLYHGSLALRHPASRAALEVLKARLRCPVFLDVNLRPPWWRPEQILDLLADATWAKFNERELAELLPHVGDASRRLTELQQRFGLQLLILTRGGKGALVRTAQGGTYEISPKQGIHGVDTVGAGDAFASILLLGLAREWPLGTTLERAQTFASAIVGIRGAVSTDPGFYRPFADAWGA